MRYLLALLLCLFFSIASASETKLINHYFDGQVTQEALRQIKMLGPDLDASPLEEGWIDTQENFGSRLTRTFDSDDRLLSIETEILNGQNYKLYRSEHLKWSDQRDLIEYTICDSSKKPILSRAFIYDHQGNLTQETLIGNLTGNSKETYTVRYSYQNGKLHRQEADNGTCIIHSYKGDQISARHFYEKETLKLRHLYEHPQIIIDEGEDSQLRKIVTFEGDSYVRPIREEIEDLINGTTILLAEYTSPKGSIDTWKEDLGAGSEMRAISYEGGSWIQSEQRDSLGRRTKIQYPEVKNEHGQIATPSLSWEYNPLDHMTTMTDSRGRTLRFRMNVRGQATELVFPDGTIQKMRYDLSGNLIEVIHPNGTRIFYDRDCMGRILSRTCLGVDGIFQTITATYTPFSLVSLTDDQGRTNTFKMNEEGKLSVDISEWNAESFYEEFLISTSTSPSFASLKQCRHRGEEHTFWSFTDILRCVNGWTTSFLGFFRKDVAFLDEIDNEFELFCSQFIGPAMFIFAGYKVEDVQTGCIGLGEISNKIRVTHINGILNTKEMCLESVKRFSDFHGGVNIHYSFRPTEGWTHDLLNGLMVKLGFTSPSAFQLAKKWQALIDEMGGTNGGGTILHYAHSIGGGETDCARHLISPEEQRMIDVVTFGSPKLLPDKGFRSVINYVSRRDGVSVLDFYGYVYAWLYEPDNVVFVGSSQGIPLIDHLMTMETYTQVLLELGEAFVKKYGSLQEQDQ